MKINKLPFNINLLSTKKDRYLGISPVRSMSIYDSDGDLDPHGLYSVEIFGPLVSKERYTRHSYIDIKLPIMHPKIFLELGRLKGTYQDIMKGELFAIWDKDTKEFIKSDIIEGETGYSFFMKHYKDIVFMENESNARRLRIELLNQNRDDSLYRYVPVIPAGLRDVQTDEEGRDRVDDINKLYLTCLAIANTIPDKLSEEDGNSTIYDNVRWTLQLAVNEIYEYIYGIIEGKHGFIMGKWGGRGTNNSTRNVITAMDSAPTALGDPTALTLNDTKIGLYQYLQGSKYTSVFDIKNGCMKRIIESVGSNIPVVDKDTLKTKYVDEVVGIKTDWGSDESIEGIINKYANTRIRHDPIKIGDDYAALIYRDDTKFKIFYDIDELPKTFDKGKVKPITYMEMLYVAVEDRSTKIAGTTTRYPITGPGSIYPTKLKLTSTIVTEKLSLLDDNWSDCNENLS